MTITSTPSIIHTERGLTISGTRITLYDVMDYLTAGWPPNLIKHWLPLTESQLNQALNSEVLNVEKSPRKSSIIDSIKS